MKRIQRLFLVLIGTILLGANANATRWLSRDPMDVPQHMERDPHPILDFNPYTFVGNSPINFIDPLGLFISFTTTTGITMSIESTTASLIGFLQQHAKTDTKFNQLVISGHGDQDFITLDNEQSMLIQVANHGIIASSGTNMTDITVLLNTVLTKDAKIYLNGCDTGKQTNGKDNLAHDVSMLLDGRLVRGPRGSARGLSGGLYGGYIDFSAIEGIGSGYVFSVTGYNWYKGGNLQR